MSPDFVLFPMHNGSLVTSAQYGSENEQTDKFLQTRWILQPPKSTQGVSWLHTQRNCFLSIMQQMVLEMIWKALKRERHMQRNSGDCNQRIYSREQSGVSDYVITLSLLMCLNRDAEASCSIHSSSSMQNHQPHILTRAFLIFLLHCSYSLMAFKGSLSPNFFPFLQPKTQGSNYLFSRILRECWTNYSVKNCPAWYYKQRQKTNSKISLQALSYRWVEVVLEGRGGGAMQYTARCYPSP